MVALILCGKEVSMIFNEIKGAVSVPEAAQQYGVKTRNNGMCRCLFHDDRHPSMKLYRDNYFCFACGAHGDVIDLVGRIYGLSAMQAAEKLIRDFGLDIPIGQNLSPPEKEKRRAIANEALRKEKIHRAFSLAIRELRAKLVRCKEILDGWKHSLAPADKEVPAAEWDSRFVTALIWSDYIDYLIDLIDFGENDERYELFVHRKEVEAIADGLITNRNPDENHRERTAS